MEFVNLTPHEILIRVGLQDRVLPSAGLARVSSTEEVVGEVDGVPMVRTAYGQITGLPTPRENTMYIVSALVLEHALSSGRSDVAAPDSGATAIRNEKGHIVAVRQIRVG